MFLIKNLLPLFRYWIFLFQETEEEKENLGLVLSGGVITNNISESIISNILQQEIRKIFFHGLNISNVGRINDT